jgi:VanZ family protein
VRDPFRTVSYICVVACAFMLTGATFVFASRQFITIWLPFALAALVGWVLWYGRIGGISRTLVWLSISCGAVLCWMISEPEVSFHDHHELRYVAVVLATVCACAYLVILFRAISDRTLRWAAVIVLMSWLIAFFSSPSGGSGGMITDAMRWFSLSRDSAETLVFYVRKTIHFSFYGLLGWSSFRWVLSLDLRLRRAVVVGLLMVLVHASYDEGRQTFFADRTASVYDMMLDISGACVLVGINSVIRRSRTSAISPGAAK